MARIKSQPVGTHPSPKPVKAAPAIQSRETPSASFSSLSSTSTCPNCKTTLPDLSATEFQDHVAICTRPSTANDASCDSSVSPTPGSPPNDTVRTIIVAPKDVKEKIDFDFGYGNVVEIGPSSVFAEDSDHLIRPYLNPKAEFDYYDQNEGHEESDIDPNDPDIGSKFRFPKATPLEAFETYLKDPEDMTYDLLYHRTSMVCETLVTYQAEYDALEKHIIAHETLMKAEEKRAEELAKSLEEEQRQAEDKRRSKVEQDFKVQLALKGQEWTDFLLNFETSNPDDTDTLRHLQNLKNPQFIAAMKKKGRERTKEKEKLDLVNAPLPEHKMSKDEIDAEKRKRGRLMDSTKFEDIKMADTYGFEYSSHPKHIGQQPMNVVTRKRNVNGGEANEASRTRTQRKQTRKVYEAELSVTPETESDELPAKRARKPRIFEDGVETAGNSRTGTTSRGETPAVKTFASGKRVGRPPTKSKLQAVHLPPLSETPEPVSGAHDNPADGVDRRGKKAGPPSRNDISARQLAPKEEAQLHDAAESLVNQTVSDQAAAASPIVKPKHAGGRPRKILPGSIANEGTSTTVVAPTAKPRNKGGRPRKHPVPSPAISYNEVPILPQKTSIKVVGRIETVPLDNTIQLGDLNGVLQSTETDDPSGETSASTSRPTTSYSNATGSSFGDRRSGRNATREKTLARESAAALKSAGDTMSSDALRVQDSFSSTLGKGKRKRSAAEFDPTFDAFDSEPVTDVAVPVKKRKRRTIKAEAVASEAGLQTQGPPSTTSRGKRKAPAPAQAVESSVIVADQSNSNDGTQAAKARKIREISHKIGVVDADDAEQADVDTDAVADEGSLDPAAREALRKQRVKEEKSRKLSENMKLRWANGGMKGAQATRKANNLAKKAAKVAATSTVILPVSTIPVNIAPIQAAPPVVRLPKPKKFKATPAPVPTREPSSRARKPTRAAQGLDGAADYEDEIEQQFASEYDRYQALTGSGTPISLGKRVRRSLINLSEDTEDEMDDMEDTDIDVDMDMDMDMDMEDADDEY